MCSSSKLLVTAYGKMNKLVSTSSEEHIDLHCAQRFRDMNNGKGEIQDADFQMSVIIVRSGDPLGLENEHLKHLMACLS